MANLFGPIGDRISGVPLYMHVVSETALWGTTCILKSIFSWTIQIYGVPENDQTIPIVIHLILVKAMWPRINQWQSLFSWVKVKKYNKMCYLLPTLPSKFRNISIRHDTFVTARDTSQWSKHGGKWRDRRRRKLPVFTFRDEHNNDSTTQTWSVKLKSNDFQGYPRRETAAIGG